MKIDPNRRHVAAGTSGIGLKSAKLVGELIEYDDRMGLTAALIAGVYPQPNMRDQAGRSLCLFDKRARMAFAIPADTWK